MNSNQGTRSDSKLIEPDIVKPKVFHIIGNSDNSDDDMVIEDDEDERPKRRANSIKVTARGDNAYRTKDEKALLGEYCIDQEQENQKIL